MSYISPFPDFQVSLATLSQQNWLPVSLAYNLVNQLFHIYFPAQDARNSGLSVVESFINHIPPFTFSPDLQTRFGDDVWVNMSSPFLYGLLSQIASCLQYKDRMFEKTNIGNTTVSTTSNTPAYLRAFNSYFIAIRELSDALADVTNLWNRRKFEMYYVLTWIP